METTIKLWANLTYTLLQEHKIDEAIKYLKQEYNGSVFNMAEVLSKLLDKMKGK